MRVLPIRSSGRALRGEPAAASTILIFGAPGRHAVRGRAEHRHRPAVKYWSGRRRRGDFYPTTIPAFLAHRHGLDESAINGSSKSGALKRDSGKGTTGVIVDSMRFGSMTATMKAAILAGRNSRSGSRPSRASDGGGRGDGEETPRAGVIRFDTK